MARPSIETRLFLNNEYVHSKSSEKLTLKNPFDDAIISDEIELAGKDDINDAVAYASEAFTHGPWSTFTGGQRAACMLKVADLFEKHAAEIAYLESLSMGRPIATLLAMDIPHMAQCMRYYAGWADKIEGESFNADDGVYKVVQHQAMGVCAGIASWNSSFLYVGWKIAPALAAGNCFIYKASEKAPLATLSLGRLFVEAGFPPGVVQFVNGDYRTGSLLSSHMQISKISITGSLPSGLKVQEAAAKSNLKSVTLELGGKSPAIVFEDADFVTALNGCAGFLFNSGQICAAASRVYVQETIAEKFISGLKLAFEQSSDNMGGDPTAVTTTLGPLSDQAQFDRVMNFIEEGKKSATLLTGGGRKGTKGCFIQPTIFVDPSPQSKIYKEEIFGPVLVIKTFKTESDAIALANDTTYGLVACIYTSNLTCALRMSSKLDAGGISINSPYMPHVQVPFGGFKQSGQGKEMGKYGLMEYLKTKTVLIR